jgi:competence transcription factor ComK
VHYKELPGKEGLKAPFQMNEQVRHRCFLSVILATQKAETRRITVHGQLGQIVLETLFQKYPTQGAKKQDPISKTTKGGLRLWLK